MIASHLILGLLLLQSGSAPHVVRFEGNLKNVKYVYGVAEPVARLRSGDILETNTIDAFNGVLKKPGDTMANMGHPNPLTGPFYIEGAQPGDTLAVKILDLQVNSPQGVGAHSVGFGALNETSYTRMLNTPLPEKVWYYPIDAKSNTATFHANDSNFSVKIPLKPFFGCIGVAPGSGEAINSLVPREFGGNMDASEASVGNTIYFPVNEPGALLYMGDGHAVQGDGEIAGTAIEVPLRARLQIDVIKGKQIAWPRFENDKSIMVAGSYRPLDDALRIAFSELVGWMHTDYGLSNMDAYELLSKVARIHLAAMVDPNYTVIAIIDKQFLPPRKK
jgi:acetamidase/formamidase